jgi:hypothetical protein
MKRTEGRSAGDRERDQRALMFCCGAWQRRLRGGKGWPFSGSIGRGEGMYMRVWRLWTAIGGSTFMVTDSVYGAFSCVNVVVCHCLPRK